MLSQRADNTDRDFLPPVDSDMKMLDLQPTNHKTAHFSSFDFKKLVRLKARQAQFKYKK